MDVRLVHLRSQTSVGERSPSKCAGASNNRVDEFRRFGQRRSLADLAFMHACNSARRQFSTLKIDLKDSVTHRFPKGCLLTGATQLGKTLATQQRNYQNDCGTAAHNLEVSAEIMGEAPQASWPALLGSISLSILAVAWGSRSAWERPNAVCELQHQKAVVLARGPKCPIAGIQMNLRRAPIRSTG